MNLELDPVFAGEEPEDVLRIFSEICRIPHDPFNRIPISTFIADYVRDLGYEPIIDEAYNVIVRKPASPGKENDPPVMLQAHYDMVCQAEIGYEFDFKKDALKLCRDGDKIYAEGTTLGGDDGIDVAAVLAILADKDAVHPPLECVFTANEEDGMDGARRLDFSQFKSKMIINLDASPTKIGCFGAAVVHINVPKEETEVKDGLVYRRITVGGLTGGHTGTQAMREPGNAIILLGRILHNIDKITDYQLCSVYGGPGGSFTKIATADIAVPADKIDEVEALTAKFGELFLTELLIQDPGVKVTIEECDKPKSAYTDETAFKIKSLLILMCDGVYSRNQEFTDTAEATAAVTLVEERGDKIFLLYAVRSLLSSKRDLMYDKIKLTCEVLGIETELIRSTPAWRTTINDDMRELLREVYPDRPPVLCKGTMECGIFYENLPKDCSMLALGVPFYLPHSPTEYILLSTTKLFYDRLREFISKVDWKHIEK